MINKGPTRHIDWYATVVVALCLLGGLGRLLAGDPWWQAASSTGAGIAILLGARALVVAFRRGWQEG